MNLAMYLPSRGRRNTFFDSVTWEEMRRGGERKWWRLSFLAYAKGNPRIPKTATAAAGKGGNGRRGHRKITYQ